jgi:hypothetical protein
MSRSFFERTSTWRGTYIDLWTVPHLISGVIIGYLLYFFSVGFWVAFWIALSIGIGWELFERISELSRTEAYTNSVCDIIAAQAGFLAAYFLLEKFNSPSAEAPIIFILCAVFGILCLLGYRAFKYYG